MLAMSVEDPSAVWSHRILDRKMLVVKSRRNILRTQVTMLPLLGPKLYMCSSSRLFVLLLKFLNDIGIVFRDTRSWI